MLTTPNNLTGDIQHFLPLVVPWATRLLGAVLICVVGIWLSGKGGYLTAKMLGRTKHFDQMLKDFLASIVRYLILTFTVLTVLSQFGIQTTSLVAVIGAASLAIGLALQGTLSNLAAGVMLLIFRPFRIGHHVIIGANTGTVKELTLFWTELVTDDAVQVIIPNSGVWGTALKNLTTYGGPPALAEVRIPVKDEAKFAEARDKVLEIVKGNADIAPVPEATVLFDRSTVDQTLQVVAKFVPLGPNPDVVRSAVFEKALAALATG